MSKYICYLITVLYEENDNTLLQCALKIKSDDLSKDCKDYFLEPESKAEFAKHLPMHVRRCGPIVDVKEIFAVHEVKNEKG